VSVPLGVPSKAARSPSSASQENSLSRELLIALPQLLAILLPYNIDSLVDSSVSAPHVSAETSCQLAHHLLAISQLPEQSVSKEHQNRGRVLFCSLYIGNRVDTLRCRRWLPGVDDDNTRYTTRNRVSSLVTAQCYRNLLTRPIVRISSSL